MSQIKDFGPAGENLAVKYLKSNQFKILIKITVVRLVSLILLPEKKRRLFLLR